MNNSQMLDVVLETILSMLKDGADKADVVDYINRVQAQLAGK